MSENLAKTWLLLEALELQHVGSFVRARSARPSRALNSVDQAGGGASLPRTPAVIFAQRWRGFS